jgi:hypothetical protein
MITMNLKVTLDTEMVIKLFRKFLLCIIVNLNIAIEKLQLKEYMIMAYIAFTEKNRNI